MRTSIAYQSIEELGGAGSVLVRQRRDHERLDELLRRVRAPAETEQDEALMRICRLVFPHAFAEEAVLWPALRRALPDGEEVTVHVEREHQEINEVVAALDRSRHHDRGRPELIERAIVMLRQTRARRGGRALAASAGGSRSPGATAARPRVGDRPPHRSDPPASRGRQAVAGQHTGRSAVVRHRPNARRARRRLTRRSCTCGVRRPRRQSSPGRGRRRG